MSTVVRSGGVKFEHFILSRFWFSRGVSFNESLSIGPETEEWLDNRLKLFEVYCLPSVVGQSNQNFRWFIYFDKKAPAAFLDRVRLLVSPWSNIEVCTSEEYYVPGQVAPYNREPPRRSEIIENIRAQISPSAEWILTSRLDSDDGLRKDFVERLHSAVRGPINEFLNFPNGILYYNDQCYLYRHLSNAFISRLEPVQTFGTVICGPHERLGEVGTVRQLSPEPGFLQVVHGTNASNKPRGQRVPQILALHGFESIGPLAQPLEESHIDILMTNLVGSTRWAARDWMIERAKLMKSGLRSKT